MDSLTIMVSIVKSSKNKLQLFPSKGYKIKVDKNSYLLFEKEDYVTLINLERVFFDLFKNVLFINNEHKNVRVFFRMTLIENYVENLPEIKFKIFYNKHKCKNPFEIKFPNLSFFDCYDYFKNYNLLDEIWEKLEELEGRRVMEFTNTEMEEMLHDKINV